MRKSLFITGLLIASSLFLTQRPAAKAETLVQESTKPKKVIVEVKKGDNLSKIAKKQNTTHIRLFDANTEIKDPDLIYPGMKLRVPSENEKLKSRYFEDTKQATKAAPIKTNKQATYNLMKTYTQRSVSTTARAVSGSIWERLAVCESGGNWGINTGNGYYGGLQFSASTWRAVGGSGLPHQASKAEQIKRGQILQSRSGWGQWPACTAKLGLR